MIGFASGMSERSKCWLQSANLIIFQSFENITTISLSPTTIDDDSFKNYFEVMK